MSIALTVGCVTSPFIPLPVQKPHTLEPFEALYEWYPDPHYTGIANSIYDRGLAPSVMAEYIVRKLAGEYPCEVWYPRYSKNYHIVNPGMSLIIRADGYISVGTISGYLNYIYKMQWGVEREPEEFERYLDPKLRPKIYNYIVSVSVVRVIDAHTQEYNRVTMYFYQNYVVVRTGGKEYGEYWCKYPQKETGK